MPPMLLHFAKVAILEDSELGQKALETLEERETTMKAYRFLHQIFKDLRDAYNECDETDDMTERVKNCIRLKRMEREIFKLAAAYCKLQYH